MTGIGILKLEWTFVESEYRNLFLSRSTHRLNPFLVLTIENLGMKGKLRLGIIRVVKVFGKKFGQFKC